MGKEGCHSIVLELFASRDALMCAIEASCRFDILFELETWRFPYSDRSVHDERPNDAIFALLLCELLCLL